MVKDLECEMFLETDEISPLAEKDMDCIGNISDFFGDGYPCDDIYRYWVFRNFSETEKKFYAFWELGNGWWSGKYFVADDLVSLWKELKIDAGSDTEAVNGIRQMTNEEASDDDLISALKKHIAEPIPELAEDIYKALENKVDDVYAEFQSKLKIESGDISPMQLLRQDQLLQVLAMHIYSVLKTER